MVLSRHRVAFGPAGGIHCSAIIIIGLLVFTCHLPVRLICLTLPCLTGLTGLTALAGLTRLACPACLIRLTCLPLTCLAGLTRLALSHLLSILSPACILR